ncbi:MAG: site-specific integrase [Deltaproteobacteria bacterium]|nr:site-specific integrase [Deltaproteobacteria bacterium]
MPIHATLRRDNSPDSRRGPALLAGCRRTEIFSLTWVQVDQGAGTLRLEAGMTKNGGRRVVLLNDIAKETLERALGYRRPGSDFVFPVDNRQGRVSWAQRSWERAKRRAGIDPKVRVHELRHSVGSLLGHIYPEAVVAKMLGHLDSRTTRKYYINFNNEQLREAADAVSRRIGEAVDEAARPAE